MKIINLNKKPAQWAMLIFISFIWGASFILMKKGLVSFSPVQVGSLRIFIAFLILLPFTFKIFKKLKRKDIKSLLIVGFIGNLFPAILFALAQTHVNSSLAAMLNTAFPITALIIGVLFYNLKAQKNKIIGTVIGLIGAAGLVSGDSLDFSGENNFYSLYIILAVIFYAVSLNEIKSNLKDLDGISITLFAFLFIGPFAGLYYFFFTDVPPVFSSQETLTGFLYIVLLAAGSSAAAVSLFYLLTDYVDVIFASLITYIIPVFAIFWGLFDGEKISFPQIIFMGVIFLGVWLVNRNDNKIPKIN